VLRVHVMLIDLDAASKAIASQVSKPTGNSRTKCQLLSLSCIDSRLRVTGVVTTPL
jgi:hypothetical protein